MSDMVWDRHNVFISYKREDRPLADRVKEELEAAGFRCWIDDRVNLGVEFWDVICRAIMQAQVVLVLVRSTTPESPWVLQEIEYAREQQRHVVPVLVGVRAKERQPTWLWPNIDDLNAHEMPEIGRSGGERDADETESGIAALVERLREDGVGSLRDRIDHDLLLHRLGDTPLDSTDEDRLKWLATETVRHFSGTPSPDYPTVHGLRHTNGILTALSGLLPLPLCEDREAVFALAAAACLHDWGRFSRFPDTCGGSSGGERASQRRQHHCRSRAAVYELAGEAELSPDEALLIADLCYYHNVRTNLHELSARPAAAEAAALFRLANACDLGLLRGPASYWQLYGQANAWTEPIRDRCFPSELPRDCRPAEGSGEQIADAAFWMRSQMVSAVRADRREREITLFITQTGPALDLVSRQARGYLERMLLQLRPLIGEWTVTPDVSRTSAGRPAFTWQDCILLGTSAYTDPEAVVSSSSAVADYAISSALALTEEVDQRHVSPTEARDTMRRLVHGIILQRPELQLPHWLRSELQRTANVSFKGFRRRFEVLQRGRQAAPLAAGGHGCFQCDYPLSALAANAYAKLPADGDLSFVIFGHSRPVHTLIQHCVLAGREVRVLVPLMRPVGEGPTLQAVEELERLRKLQNPGLKVEVVPDVALAHLLTRPEHEHTTALMGCEAWIGRQDELVANSLGCLTFAHIVRGCGKALWVLAERAKKLTSLVPRSPYGKSRPKSQVGPMPASAYVHEAEASRYLARSSETYPRSETVPAGLVSAVVSEDKFREGDDTLFTPQSVTRCRQCHRII